MNAPKLSSHPHLRQAGLAAVAAGAAAIAGATGLASVAEAATGGATPAATTVTATGVLYGDPGWATRYWYPQTQEDCTLVSSADVTGQVTGIEPTEAAVISRAQSLHLYDPDEYDSADQSYGGGPITENPALIVQLLSSYGVQSTYETGRSVTELEQDLAGGRAVIAGVDAEDIWNVTDASQNPGDDQDSYEDDHAVTVTGINTATQTVYLNDSGDPEVGRGEQVPLAVFEKAWAAPFATADGATVDDILVVTTKPTLAAVSQDPGAHAGQGTTGEAAGPMGSQPGATAGSTGPAPATTTHSAGSVPATTTGPAGSGPATTTHPAGTPATTQQASGVTGVAGMAAAALAVLALVLVTVALWLARRSRRPRGPAPAQPVAVPAWGPIPPAGWTPGVVGGQPLCG